MTLAGIWLLVDFTAQLIVLDQIYVQEVLLIMTLEECSKCIEIVEKYTTGNSTEVKCRLRRDIFYITQIRKN